MTHRSKKPDDRLSELTIRLTLDAPAETLGLADGYQRFFDDGAKQKKHRGGAAEGGFLLDCRAAGDACLCEIRAARDPREWEKIPPVDYFRYTEALAAGYLLRLRQRLKTDLRPHITGVAVETPLTACLHCPEEAPPSLLRHARKLFPERQDMRVTAINESGSVPVLTLQKTDGFTAAWFRPGQYILLGPQNGTGAAEPFLLCASPALTREGKYKAAALPKGGPAGETPVFTVGEELPVSAPLGDFYYDGLRDRHAVIGITDRYGIGAFLSMAASLRDGLEQFRLTVFYFSPAEDVHPFAQEWESIRRECGRVRLIPLKGTVPETALDTAALRQWLPHEAYSVFLCGESSLCRAALRTLDVLKLPRGAVRVCAVDRLPEAAAARNDSPPGERI
ncbi:MAG: hypothetical protein IJK98_04315 [Clostridia bacterium]|nr:hypothetical protein [Clostridia bacterium]